MIAAVLSVIGYATLASSSERSANEVFVVPLAVPTYAATPVPTVGPATPSPIPSPDALLDGGGHGEAAAVDADLTVSEPDEPSVEGLAGAEGLDGIEAIICAYDWWGSCERALRVARCEVGPDYIDGNPYDDYVGTWQVAMSVHAAKFQGDPYDPVENTRVAYEIYVNGGERHWPVCRYA